MHARRIAAVSMIYLLTALAANELARAAADPLPEYSPGLKASNQRFTAPEGSARPGEAFFYKAARAVSKQDYGFAVDMYRVSASWAFKPTGSHLGEGTGHMAVGGKGGSGRSCSKEGDALAESWNAFGIIGSGALDGSEAYRRLRETDDPYDVKLKQPTGTATVKDIIPIGDDAKSALSTRKSSNFY